MGQCLLFFVIIALLNIANSGPAIADSGRASLRHIDAGKSIPEKLSNAKSRSQKRLEALKSSLTTSSLHGRQLDTTYRSKILYAEEYLMEVLVGSPAKKFTAILDTGSDIVWFKCNPCSACESADSASCNSCPPTVLDYSQSTSFSAIPCNSTQCSYLPEVRTCEEVESNTCEYHYGYADESYNNGQYVSEALYLLSDSGPSQPFDVVLGCAHTLTGDFSGADGLVGFGMGSSSLISQVSSLHGKFSYCLTSYTESNNSVLLLGNSSAISDPSVSSTPIIQSSSQLYYVKLKSITVGDTLICHSNASSSADINSAGTIFDSGTTLTYLDTNIFNYVKDAFVHALPDIPVLLNYHDFDVCFNMSGVSSSVQFLSLSFQFDGALLNPPQTNYLAFVDSAKTIKCLLLTPADDGLGIIGNILQQNYLVAHDITGMKLSFLEKNLPIHVLQIWAVNPRMILLSILYNTYQTVRLLHQMIYIRQC